MPEIINPVLRAKIDPKTGQPVVQQPQPFQIGNLQGTPAQPVSTLNISTGNPALKTLFDSANQLLNTYTSQGGQLTSEIQQRIQNMNQTELQKQASVAGARTAADNKDAPALDTHLTTAKTAETTQQADIQGLLSELKAARESYIGSLAPAQAEQDLQMKLNTLRTERQLLPIELRQEGISAPGIAGRQVEDERVRAIQEQNLLLELGLKQDARKMSTLAKEKQIDFIDKDIALRQKIQDNLTAREDKLVEQARNLRQDSLKALSDLADRFKGLAWTDLDPQTQSDVLNLLKAYPDITPNILSDTLSIAKQQQVFDNAIKMKEKTEESVVDIRQRRNDLADLLGQVASYKTRDEATSELDKYRASIVTKIGEEGYQKLQKEIDRLFPPPKETEEEKVGEGIVGAVSGFFQRLFGK